VRLVGGCVPEPPPVMTATRPSTEKRLFLWYRSVML
jgi:hypothetical protein